MDERKVSRVERKESRKISLADRNHETRINLHAPSTLMDSEGSVESSHLTRVLPIVRLVTTDSRNRSASQQTRALLPYPRK